MMATLLSRSGALSPVTSARYPVNSADGHLAMGGRSYARPVQSQLNTPPMTAASAPHPTAANAPAPLRANDAEVATKQIPVPARTKNEGEGSGRSIE